MDTHWFVYTLRLHYNAVVGVSRVLHI